MGESNVAVYGIFAGFESGPLQCGYNTWTVHIVLAFDFLEAEHSRGVRAITWFLASVFIISVGTRSFSSVGRLDKQTGRKARLQVSQFGVL